ncbi:ATP-binding cassette sub-family B member 10, mitochondrial isoform X2 [Myotis myotis]|uniref:ATP-binding cassette sub-family B member 10, mitochondrial isoform X2 n=1 Tax=Myotis myotis TaxID=51298 RepID=UPI00174D2981|nr:ATP-binding cassette sub-family B member 10, mitochondrial isoform X2 [Myotis myotis]
MRGPLAWPLRLLVRRGPLACAWTPSARAPVSRPLPTGLGPPRLWGAGPGALRGAGAARCWASGCPGGDPGGGAGLARLLGLRARPPGDPRLPRALLSGGPGGGARAGGEAWRRGPAVPAAAAAPRDDSRLRPAAAGRSEAQKLLGLAYPERRRLAAAVGFLAVSSVITMSAPFFLGRIIDIIYTSPTGDYSGSLTRLCLTLSGMFLCGAAANAIRVYLMQTSGQRIVNRLRASLFSSVLRQEVAFFDKTRTGELINRLSSDTALLGRSLTENLSDGLRAGAQASVGIGMMVQLSGIAPHAEFRSTCFRPLSQGNAVTLPALVGYVSRQVPSVCPSQDAVFCLASSGHFRFECGASNIHPCGDLWTIPTETDQTHSGLPGTSHAAEERIGNIRTVRAFGKEMTEIEKYTSKVDFVMQLARKEAIARAGFFGACLPSGLSSFYSELMKGLGAGGRLWELLERKPGLPFDEGLTLNEKSFQGALEFKNVHFTYPARPEVPIFQDFSLSIPSGSVTALVGPSGSGKSTVVSLLLRLYDPLSGTISLDGRDIRQLNPVWLRSKIGTVSQEPVLFSCSIAENIAYGAEDPSAVTPEQVERVAEVANATAFIRSFPQGFSTMVGEKGVLLSGGQKQRIAIARALLKNPRILLLDEATSALDAENEYLVQEALDRLMEGRTVLIIAHRLSTIKNANMVAVLDRGKIIECGNHDELLAKPDGIYRKLMNKQSFVSA